MMKAHQLGGQGIGQLAEATCQEKEKRGTAQTRASRNTAQPDIDRSNGIRGICNIWKTGGLTCYNKPCGEYKRKKGDKKSDLAVVKIAKSQTAAENKTAKGIKKENLSSQHNT